MNNITDVKKEDCFGCSACMSICKKNAIMMTANSEGFMFPIVDENKCSDCGICRKVCPAINRWNDSENKACNSDNSYYAYQNMDIDVLKKSTSGGVFSGIVDAVENPYVCGCVVDDNLYVKHLISNKEDDIVTMRGSKYVQSDLSHCFKDIQKKLEKGENVIFTGTSCQTHGLLNFLDVSRTSTDNLITLDLICHGVPSNLMHKEYIANYELKKNTKVVTHYFRSKRQKWGTGFILRNHEETLVLENGLKDRRSLESQLWLNVFFSDLCLRECCYKCPYCRVDKPADITMADFWGIERTCIDMNFSEGCSLMIARGKGNAYAQKLKGAVQLDKDQMTIAKKFQMQLSTPCVRPESRDLFWRDYYKNGFLYVAKKYLRYDMKYKVLMLIYNFFNLMKDKRFAQKIGNKLFY